MTLEAPIGAAAAPAMEAPGAIPAPACTPALATCACGNTADADDFEPSISDARESELWLDRELSAMRGVAARGAGR
jgi:hypothetical protein